MNPEYFMLMVFIGCLFALFSVALLIEALLKLFIPDLYKKVVFGISKD